MTQREDPKDASAMAMFRARTATQQGPGGRFSGGKILDFERGWALRALPFSEAAHFFRRRGDEWALSACGRVQARVALLYGQGNFPQCRSCAKTVKAMQR